MGLRSFVYHFTDVVNAVEILKCGALLSRQGIKESGSSFKDCASPEVMQRTDDTWKDYVRLYFRPKSPTLYSNEGMRPKGQREHGGAHCPVPIYLLFDAKNVLTMAGTKFSRKSLAARSSYDGFGIVGDSAPFFRTIPFEKVYHSSHFRPEERDDIIVHRHAEVLVPGRLELVGNLKTIYCRSQAEFETFIDLLPESVLQTWRKRIGVGTKLSLFNSRWTFVQKADLSYNSVVFHFNPSSITPGPFQLKLVITDLKKNKSFNKALELSVARGSVRFGLEKIGNPMHYRVQLFLDDDLAYQNTYEHELSDLF